MDGLGKFIDGNLLPHDFLCVLQVGSSSRGYALDNSDVDLMAFYRVSGDFRAFPNHTMFGDTRVTLEHHDLHTFMIENGDFRFNPGSLRQMHKVRDGLPVVGDVTRIEILTEIARAASLDTRIPLRYLASIFPQITTCRTEPHELQHQRLIEWTEMAATFLVTSIPGAPAYSKPKWLLKTLDAALLTDAAALLRSYYEPSASQRHSSLDGLLGIYENVSAHISESYRILLRTAMNDAAQMMKHAPEDAGPAVRFAAIQLWRSLHGRSPLVDLRAGAQVPGAVVEALGTVEPSRLDDWWQGFAQFLNLASESVAAPSRKKIESKIGTNRFVSHLLDTYDATDMLPYLSSIRVTEWLSVSHGDQAS